MQYLKAESPMLVNLIPNSIELKFTPVLINDGIQNLINNGDAYFAVHIECPMTSFRELYHVDEKLTLKFDANDIEGFVYVCTFIIANKNLREYTNEKFNEYKETTFKTSIKLPLVEKDIYSYAVTYLDVDFFDNFNYENQIYFREAVDIVSESMLSEYDNESDIRIQKEDAINIIRQVLSGVIKIPYLIENEITKMFSRSIRVDDKGCCCVAKLRPILKKVIERYIDKHKNDEPSIRLNISTKREPKIDPNYTMSDDIKDQLHRKFFWYRFDNLAKLVNIKINGYDCKLYVFYEPKESTFSEFALKYFIEVDNDICPQYFFVTYKENLDFVEHGEDAPYFENRTFYIESVKLEKERPFTNELGILARSHQKKQLYQRFITYLEKIIK